MSGVEFFVHGIPAPQGSKTRTRYGMIESSKKVQPWREAVVSEIIRLGYSDKHLDGPLAVDILFTFKRPQSHYGSRKGVPYVKDTAPRFVAQTPDIDKCQRSTYDALTQSGLIKDDSLIVSNRNVMLYGDERFGALIIVAQVGEIK